jgi:hypothetical protein
LLEKVRGKNDIEIKEIDASHPERDADQESCLSFMAKGKLFSGTLSFPSGGL